MTTTIVSRFIFFRTFSLVCFVLLLTQGLSDAQSQPLESSCQITNARYKLMDGSKYDARFMLVAKQAGSLSDVALELSSKDKSTKFWYVFDEGARSNINLISTTDVGAVGWKAPVGEEGIRPHGDMQYVSFDRALKPVESLPQSSSYAPFYIFLPELPNLIWNSFPRQSVGHALFRLEGCASSVH